MKTLFLNLFLFFSVSVHSFEFTILHTNDLHSSFEGGLTDNRGHYARLASAIKGQRETLGNNSVVLFDAGDFFSGSLLHAIAVRPEFSYFPEYQFFDFLKYDAVTLGNHEFDAGSKGLDIMFEKISKLGNRVPIISTNFQNKSKIVKRSIIKKVVNSSGRSIKLGVIGALGPDGCSVSRGTRGDLSFIGYNDLKAASKWDELYQLLENEALRLKKNGADIVVLLLHGGGEEDEKLAGNVKGLDIIIAGHTHERYFKKKGSVFIAQAGSNGEYLGSLKVTYDTDTRKIVKAEHRNIEIDPSYEKDKEFDDTLSFYNKVLDSFLKSKYREFTNYPDTIFSESRSFKRSFSISSELGIEVTSGIAKSLKRKSPDFSVYFTSLGLIRNGIEGNKNYNLKEIFNILPIGFSEDLLPGATTLSFYITLHELKKLIQFLELYSKFNPKFTPAFSSALKFQVNHFGIPFVNRIKKFRVKGVDGHDSKKLIHVGTNNFIYKYLDFIQKKTFGMVKIIPKDKQGEVLKSNPQSYGPEFLEYASSKLK